MSGANYLVAGNGRMGGPKGLGEGAEVVACISQGPSWKGAGLEERLII